MTMRLIFGAGLLAFCASLQAGTSFQSTLVMTSNGGATVSGFPATSGQNSTVFAGVEISPYTGTITTNGNQQSITLFCDDFHDEITPGQSYTVNVTATNASTTNPLVNATAGSMANTRDGSANEAAGMPTGTTLYEELAWLTTQMMSSGQTIGNEEAIQEAMWVMTDDPNNAASPTSSPTASGATQTYMQWMGDAAYEVTGGAQGSLTAGSYLTPNYSNWLVLSVSGEGGQELGTGGVQELLAFNGPMSITSQNSSTPEPASFILLGSGLLIGAAIGRRRMGKGKSKS